MRKHPIKVYLFLEGAGALCFSMIFVASMVYEITIAKLSPLQLVLVGTALETTIFIFEIPTGVIADVYSRRLSVIAGYLIIGCGFILEGAVPQFWAIALGQSLWGLGYTFTSGATQAWITDEIGEAAAGKAFLRGSQVGSISGLAGLGLGVLLSRLSVSLPIWLGGLLLIILGLVLILIMPEHGFQPRPKEERSSWQSMARTLKDGLGMVRRRPMLLTILLVGLFFGLYSEGFDRLWTKHMLEDFTQPLVAWMTPVMWVGVVDVGSSLLRALVSGIVRRSVDTTNPGHITRLMFLFTSILIASLLFFAQMGDWFLGMLLALWIIGAARGVIGPIYTAWVNQRLDSRVRATVISISGQVDAIGQIAGGPVMGTAGNLLSVRAAITLSGLLLSPVLGLFAYANRRQEEPCSTENEP